MFQKQVLVSHREWDGGATVSITEKLNEELESKTWYTAERLPDGRWFVRKGGESLIRNGRGQLWSSGPPDGPTNEQGAYKILYNRAMNDAIGKYRYHCGWEQ